MYEAVPIKEMNTVLAVFMGYEKYTDSSGIWFKKEGLIMCLHPKLEGLAYHSSWDWLMPVWLKIENAAQDVGISFQPYLIAFHVAIDHGDILAAHRACFDFIKRYNEINNEKENNK